MPIYGKEQTKADKLFKAAGNRSMLLSAAWKAWKSTMWIVEYDHPFQKVAAYNGVIHVVRNGRSVCKPTIGVEGHDSFLYYGGCPKPCPVCFMEGDLLAMRISEPEHTEMEIDENRPPGDVVDAGDKVACAKHQALTDLDALASLLMDDGHRIWDEP